MVDGSRSAFRVKDYDSKIGATIPYYDRFHLETLDLVRTFCPAPARWLDTGCGTGTLVSRALELFPTTTFVLADPSSSMLAQSAAKLAGAISRVEFSSPAASQDLSFVPASFDVVTAICSHHYLDRPGRNKATTNCLRMLKHGGLYVTFENIRPGSDEGLKVTLDRWRTFQLGEGKSLVETEKHLSRFDQEYFPETVQFHLDMLRDIGFMVAELFWASYLQAGFWALKG